MALATANIWLGDGAVWFFALLWETGANNAPAEIGHDATGHNENELDVVA